MHHDAKSGAARALHGHRLKHARGSQGQARGTRRGVRHDSKKWRRHPAVELLIVHQGQSASVFLKITLLGVPSLISMILPVAIFVATLVALNRLHTEQEIVVCFAGGMSPWRVVSPSVRLACLAAWSAWSPTVT